MNETLFNPLNIVLLENNFMLAHLSISRLILPFSFSFLPFFFFFLLLGAADNKRVESTDSHSSDVTVKWKDTTDVEFSMGRVDSQNNSAPDAW